MKNLILTFLILALFFICCKTEKKDRNYREFLIEDVVFTDNADIVQINYDGFEKLFAQDTIEKIVFLCNKDKNCNCRGIYRNTIIAYDIKTKMLDTLLTVNDICISMFYPITKDSIYFFGENGNNNIYCWTKDSLYLWNIPNMLSINGFNNDYLLLFNRNRKLQLYDSLFIFQVFPKFDYKTNTYNYNYPLNVFFEIENNKLKLLAQKGYYPKKDLANNFYESGRFNTCYNPKTKDIIFWHPMLEKIWIENFETDKHIEKTIHSKYFKTPENITHAQRNDIEFYINYSHTNNEFSGFQYDPYRNVYLRTLQMPKLVESEDKMTKVLKISMCISVIDKDFNLKYDVYFDDDSIPSYSFPLKILKDGVYLIKYNTNSNENKFGKFIFN